MNYKRLLEPMTITAKRGFKLDDHPTRSLAAKATNKREAKAYLQDAIDRLTAFQDRFYAYDHWSLLLIFQAMDAAGKDSTIKHVMSGINPQGCQVTSFKRPTSVDLDHDFLWRCVKKLPERGRIGIFNRSYYEEVLAVRVHPEFLDAQRLPPELVSSKIWDERLEDIRAFERYLTRQGTIVMKFFLNVGLDEQRERFLDRLERPEKNWKFNSSDLESRARWPDYMRAYEQAIAATATPEAPWYVIPADQKWFMRALVVTAIDERLERLNLEYPKVPEEELANFADYRGRLKADPSGRG